MIKQKIVTGLATAALFGAFATPAFAETTIVIGGNGAKSDNTVHVKDYDKFSLYQGNETTVKNSISQHANTGNNDANMNTGGNVSIDTGKATNDASVVVKGGNNVANVDSCGCDDGDLTIKIKDNGYKSDNDVWVKNKDYTHIAQKTKTKVYNYVYQKANTGYNDANKNTGGDVDVDTGKAKNWTSLYVKSGSNKLNP